jgi:hypothetical protein
VGLSVSDIARRGNADVGDVSRSLQYAFLAPDLVERILDGSPPMPLTTERLKRTGELPRTITTFRSGAGAAAITSCRVFDDGFTQPT